MHQTTSNAACGTYEHGLSGKCGHVMASFWPICAQSTEDMYLSSKGANAKYVSRVSGLLHRLVRSDIHSLSDARYCLA